MELISKSEVLSDCIVTYANMVCNSIPHKEEKYHVRLTVGEDRFFYDKNAASPAVSLLKKNVAQ